MEEAAVLASKGRAELLGSKAWELRKKKHEKYNVHTCTMRDNTRLFLPRDHFHGKIKLIILTLFGAEKLSQVYQKPVQR